MYYINNRIYACHITDIETVILDMEDKGFSKRKVEYIQEDETMLLLEGGTADLFDKYSTPFDSDARWAGEGTAEYSEKVIMSFSSLTDLKDKAFSYYMLVAETMGLSDPEAVIKAAFPSLSGASIVEDTFAMSPEGAKGVPYGLMSAASSEMSKFSTLWMDKHNSAKDKMVLKELNHIVTNNIDENLTEFASDSAFVAKIKELSEKGTDLVLQDWDSLYSLVKNTSPLPASLDGVELDTIGEMHLVDMLHKSTPATPGFAEAYAKAMKNNIKYFRDLGHTRSEAQD